MEYTEQYEKGLRTHVQEEDARRTLSTSNQSIINFGKYTGNLYGYKIAYAHNCSPIEVHTKKKSSQ